MADTGENRQIVARANANEAETVRATQKMISKERSTAKASEAAFAVGGKGCRRHAKGNKLPGNAAGTK